MELPDWSSSAAKNTLKLADGDSVIGVFRGGITRFYQHWENNRSVRCTGRGTCRLCASDNEDLRRASGRFRMNFVLKRDKNSPFEAFIFENGKKVYEQLLAINADCPLERTKVRITRMGKGKNTTIMVQVIAGENGIVNAATEKEIAAVALHPLEDQEPAVEKEEDTSETALPDALTEEAPF
jgi:hypothetical protein